MALLLVLWLFGPGYVAHAKASDRPTCDCCDEYTLHAYAGELNRHCLPASLLRKKQDIIVGEALDGSPSVPEEALSILCASALCRSSVLRYWARVRGCSESSSWKRFGFAWAAAKVRCMRLPQEREPQDGARYQVLMQATFGHDGQQAKDAANLELASMAIKQVDLQAEEVKQSSRVLKELDLILQRAGQVQEKQWIETRQAEILIAVTITVYAFFIGFELEIEANHADVASTLSQAFLICHVVFNTVFVLEIVLRVRSVGIRYCSPFNPAGFFDAVIILIGTVENIVSVVFAMMSQDGSGSVLAIAGVMRIVRLLRLARLLRGFLVCQELRLLVTGMMLALPTVVWAGVLFAIVVYLGTMFTVILLGNIPELEGYFGTIGLALWTHFVIVTMETWPDIADTVLAVASPLWGVYFVVFICISSMSLMNLVTGVIAEKLLSTKDVTTSEDTEDEMEAFRQEKAAFKQDVCELLLYEDDIDVDIFAGLMETIKMRAWLQKLQVSPELPANDLFNLLDTECNGNLTLDQLVEGMLNLRGSRLRVHSLLLQQDLRRYCQDELDALAEVETIVVRQISKNLTSLNQTFQEELQNMQKLAEPISTAPGCDDNFSAWMAEKESLERLVTELGLLAGTSDHLK
ncbi:NaCP60E [Symbiodinium necroappetens]|uniref:NaCP60E protein n=1 Tax=Symbiodinium necroappetens TaxID=1628268 RepID=A0A812IWX2_9DINO|nr:NaCP60E [Symbiodinium necroappetens]